MDISTIASTDTKLLYVAGVEAAKEYEYEGRVRSAAPRVKLTISAFFLPGVPIEILGVEAGDLITSVSYQKDRVNAFGTFNVSMIADESKFEKLGRSGILRTIQKALGPSTRDIFKVRTLAKLDINGYHIMTGFLRGVNKTTTPSGKEYSLTFVEIGAVLQEETVSWRYRSKFMNLVAEQLPIAAALHLIPASMAINALLQIYLSNTLYLGLQCAPNTTVLTSDGFPLGMRLISQPPPLGGMSLNSWITNTPLSIGMFDNGSNQSLWDFLKAIAKPPYMEMFTESGGRTIVCGRSITGGNPTAASLQSLTTVGAATTQLTMPNMNVAALMPGFCYVVMRSTPYDNPLTGIDLFAPVTYPFTMGMFDLITGGDFVIISDRDVISKTLGQSDEQQYTMFDVSFTRTEMAKWNNPVYARGPLNPVAGGGIKSFGPKLFDSEIDFTTGKWDNIYAAAAEELAFQLPLGNGTGSPYATKPVLSSLAATWFRNASKYMEGTITTRAIPYARPGMVLLYLPDKTGHADDIRELGMYYIDSISGSYTHGKADTTTFNVIRGTPLPWDASTLAMMLLDWEIGPTPILTPVEDSGAGPRPPV